MNRNALSEINKKSYSPATAWMLGIVSLVAGLPAAVLGQSGGPVAPVAARVEQSQLDPVLVWLQEAKRNYGLVKDYTCTLVSQERVGRELQEENIMQLKVKAQPFSIYMRWLAPKKNAGREVVFVQGRNKNNMRVKDNFVGKNLIGFVSIDPNDPRVLEHSRHNIMEAGIGNMIDATIKQWTIERASDKVQVRTAEYNFDRRDCYRIEVTRLERHPSFYSYRAVLFLEKQSKLPILMENYDWPRQGGPPEGDLLESFKYVNLQFNTGLRDEEFNK